MYSLNAPEDFLLAIVEFRDEGSDRVHYLVCYPLQREPDFGVTSGSYDLAKLLARADTPR